MRRVVIVEQEEAARAELRQALRVVGFLPAFARTWLEMLELSERQPPRVVIINRALLPGQVGDAIAVLRRRLPTTEVLLSVPPEQHREAASLLAAGAFALCTQPLVLGEVSVLLQRADALRNLADAYRDLRDRFDEIREITSEGPRKSDKLEPASGVALAFAQPTLGLPSGHAGDPRQRTARQRARELLGGQELSIKKASRFIEEELIRQALQRTQGNRTHAADLLEISHRSLLYKLKEFQIE